MNILIILGSFLLSLFSRALITKYILPLFSITSISVMALSKKYLFIFIIIFIPLLIINMILVFFIGDSIDYFYDVIFNENSYILIFFLYILEAFAIIKIIPTHTNKKIPFKIAIILISIFFIFDSALDMVTTEIDINENINQTIDDNISNIKITQ